MSKVLEGGCLCSAVRYRVTGEPRIVQVCHCRYCQRRLGTAFAELAYFASSQLELLDGALAEYEHRSDESGRWLRHRFCPRCGTTVLITLELSPLTGVHLGTLDDPEALPTVRHIWTRSKRPWVNPPEEAQCFSAMANAPPPRR
jgi:hypothetical protein